MFWRETSCEGWSPAATVNMKDEPEVDDPRTYRAYLLRIRLMDNDGCPEWLFSLTDSHGVERIQFKNFAGFISFLAAGLAEDLEEHTYEES